MTPDHADMTPGPLRLYYALMSMADAVDAASAGEQEAARMHLDDARCYALAFTRGAPPETGHALGRLLTVSSPARYRVPGFSLALRGALSAHGSAVLTAANCGINPAVQANADASDAARPMPVLHAAFGVIRNEICGIARATEVTA